MTALFDEPEGDSSKCVRRAGHFGAFNRRVEAPWGGGHQNLSSFFDRTAVGVFFIIKRYFLSKSLQQLGAFGLRIPPPLRHIALILLS